MIVIIITDVQLFIISISFNKFSLYYNQSNFSSENAILYDTLYKNIEFNKSCYHKQSSFQIRIDKNNYVFSESFKRQTIYTYILPIHPINALVVLKLLFSMRTIGVLMKNCTHQDSQFLAIFNL